MVASMEEFTQLSVAETVSGEPHVVYDANMLLVNINNLILVSARFLDLYLLFLSLFHY